MNILTEKGLYKLSECRTMCEYRYTGNGVKHRSLEEANKLEYANGIMFVVETSTGNYFDGNKTFFIGNLSNEKVREILSTLNSEGYFDISEWQFQDAPSTINLSEYALGFLFDNGESLPYICHEYEAGCFGRYGTGVRVNTFPMDMPEEVEKDDGEE